MPFDGIDAGTRRLPKRDPRGAESALVLEMVEAFFKGGRLWTQYSATAGNGERCLVEAIHHVRRQIRCRSDQAQDYLARGIRQTCRDWRGVRESRDVVEGYNDTRGRTYPEIALVIREAKNWPRWMRLPNMFFIPCTRRDHAARQPGISQ